MNAYPFGNVTIRRRNDRRWEVVELERIQPGSRKQIEGTLRAWWGDIVGPAPQERPKR